MNSPFDKGSDKHGKGSPKVVSIFTGRSLEGAPNNPIIRIAPELDGLEMLYSNKAHPDKLYSLKVACWALRADGSSHGMVPWLKTIVPCTEIQDPLEGFWQGYRDPLENTVFYDTPSYKHTELESAARHYCPEGAADIKTQLIPDTIGTHAAMTPDGFKTLNLIEIHSWKLENNGTIQGMCVNHKKVSDKPVMANDQSLQTVESHNDFRYFFQYHIANKIKNQDPDTLAAISLLINRH